MILVHEGVTNPQKLLFFLDEFFDWESSGEIGHSIQIRYLENNKGHWIIGFTTTPSYNLLLFIFAIFRSKLSYDSLVEISYNHGTQNELRIGSPDEHITELLAALEAEELPVDLAIIN